MNRHIAIQKSMEILGIEKGDVNIHIRKTKGEYEYYKSISGKILSNRSCVELIFKPFFTKQIEKYIGIENIKELLYDMALSSQPEKILYSRLLLSNEGQLTAYNIKTEEEYAIFISVLKKNNIIWVSGNELEDEHNWNYGDQSCFTLETDSFGKLEVLYANLDWFQKKNYKIKYLIELKQHLC